LICKRIDILSHPSISPRVHFSSAIDDKSDIAASFQHAALHQLQKRVGRGMAWVRQRVPKCQDLVREPDFKLSFVLSAF
jgi:hypothetical protein